jgi:hypothetical protein
MIITLTIFLFLCGIAGFILNRNNVILLIVAIELLLLAVTFINSCFTPCSFAAEVAKRFYINASLPPKERRLSSRAMLRLRSKECREKEN